MFDSPPIIVGLEIGTSKIAAVIGEVNETGALNLIGIGQSQSHGVRKGEVVDPVQAAEDVRAAIVDAEHSADVEIRSVYLGVTGAHIRGLTNRGVHPIASVDREITGDDVQDVIRNARMVQFPPQNTIIHAIRQDFIVDGVEGIANPLTMLGSRLEVDVHVVYGNENRMKNAVRVVEGLQLQVEGLIFNGLASALATLTNEDKEMGSLVIDLGGGVTEYVVYAGGVIKHTGVLAVGGDHLTNDLAYGLKVPMGRAETVKLEHGCAVIREDLKGRTLTLNNELGLPIRTINLEHLNCIVALRFEEIFQLIEAEMAQAGLLDYIRRGVFLCGGGARIPQAQQLAEQVFQLPTSVGRANSISGIKSTLDQPEFATAIGLVKFGSFQQKRRKGFMEIVKDKLDGIIHRT
jgi:cell division protein FtsA